MGGQRPMESRDRGEQTLLQVGEQEARPRAACRGLAVVVEHRGEPQLGGVRRQARDVDRLDDSLREWMTEAPEVFLEPSDHDRLQLLGLDVDAAGEPLRIEDFEQCREGVGMTIVRRGGEEKPVFEQRRDFPHRPRHLAFDGPGGPGRRCRVMGLVQDEHRARPERRENIAQTRHIGLVGKNAVRDDEARADAPGVRRKAAGAPRLEQVVPIDDGEVETEFLREFVLPLQQHRSGRGDDDHVDAAPQQQFPHD